MNKLFPCKCGHLIEDHERILSHDHIDYCEKCDHVIGLNAVEAGAFHDYEPDNLRFLEVKSDENSKV